MNGGCQALYLFVLPNGLAENFQKIIVTFTACKDRVWCDRFIKPVSNA